MLRAAFVLFVIWFLLLPFSAISSLYFSVADLAVDKVMSPLLILLWFMLLISGRCTIDKKKILLLAHVFAFFIIRNISFMDNLSVYKEVMWRDAILFGYFALPVLYIDSLKRVDVAARLISFNAAVACLSAFLVAFGVIELPYERFSESRLGYEEIKKSIGVITAYGDVTQLAAFFLLFGLFIPEKLLPVSWRSYKSVKVIVFAIIVMGLIGNQSRSYLLSIIFAYGTALFFTFRSKKLASRSLLDILTVFGIVFIVPLMLFMLSDIVSSLAGLGGKEAMGSASARLGQYEMAFSLISENPLFGVGSEFYIRNTDFAHGVHNLWLGQMTRGGIVSALILLLLLMGVFRKCVALFKIESALSYAKVLIGYLAALFMSTLFYPADSDIFWALFGMAASIIYVLDKKDVIEQPEGDEIAVKVKNNRVIPKRIINS